VRRAILLIAAACVPVAAVVWFIVGAGEGPTMKGMGERRTTLSRDGTRIAFTKMGSGPAVVLVDGAFCFRENGPAPDLSPLLAQQFTVFAYDRRGRGESADTPPYSIDREIDDLRAIVDEAGGSAFVVGVSSGAALALHAVAAGVNIPRLVLYEPPFVKTFDGAPTPDASRAHLEQLLSVGDRRGAVKYFLADVVGVPRPIVFVMPFLMRAAWRHNEAVAHTLPYDLAILRDRSVITDRRTSIATPTLVVGGEKSPVALRDAVTLVARSLPHARAQLLAGQTHMLKGAVVAPVVRDFFTATPARL
jgi:pimeloyl-ACP methyl ester carboxylesterase